MTGINLAVVRIREGVRFRMVHEAGTDMDGCGGKEEREESRKLQRTKLNTRIYGGPPRSDGEEKTRGEQVVLHTQMRKPEHKG